MSMKRTCAISSAISFLTSSAMPAQLRRLAQAPLHHSFGAGEAASFWKRGSFRSGSNIGSRRSSAGVSGAAPGIEQLALLSDEHFRVADNVDEQDVSDLEFHV